MLSTVVQLVGVLGLSGISVSTGEDDMGMKPTVNIAKGTDAFIQMTALSEYCRQQGYKIIEENVTIEMPKGKELQRLNDDVRSGKLMLLPSSLINDDPSQKVVNKADSLTENARQSVSRSSLPETGFLRLKQILGDRRNGIPPIIPVSKSSWWAGVKSGRYPKPVKLSPRCTCWRINDVLALIAKSNEP